jgi:hypothetical protein
MVVVLMVVGEVGGVDCKKCLKVRVEKKGGEVFLFYILFFFQFLSGSGSGSGKDRYQGYFSASSFFSHFCLVVVLVVVVVQSWYVDSSPVQHICPGPACTYIQLQ